MYVRAKVTPGARKEYIEKTEEGEFKVAVREKAKRNLANKRVLFLIARALGAPEGAVRIANGHRSATKLLRVEESAKSREL